MRRRLAFACAAVIALGVMASGPASAQLGFNLYRSGATDLSAEDLQFLRMAVREVLESREPGKTVEWRNPNSNIGGTATLVRSYKNGPDDCGAVTFTVGRAGRGEAAFDFDLCQRADGVWGLAQ